MNLKPFKKTHFDNRKGQKDHKVIVHYQHISKTVTMNSP